MHGRCLGTRYVRGFWEWFKMKSCKMCLDDFRWCILTPSDSMIVWSILLLSTNVMWGLFTGTFNETLFGWGSELLQK